MTIHSDIDKIFKEGLADYSQRPPGFVWDAIEQELAKNRFKKRRNILYAAAASIAILFSFGAGFLFNNNDVKNSLVAGLENTSSQNEIIENQPMIAQNDNVLSVAEKPNADEIATVATPNSTKTSNSSDKNKITTSYADTEVEKKEEKVVPIKKKASSVKKVSSEGSLLPPSFASQNDYETVSNLASIDKNDGKEDLELIEKQKFDLAVALEERDLKYEYREVPMFAYADDDNADEKISNWSVGINASPLVSYREVNGVDKEVLTAADITSNYEQQYQNEKPLVSYSAGVDVNYNITKRLKVQSGIYFSEMGQISQNVNVNKSQSYYNANGEQYYAVNTSMGNVNIKGSQNQLVNQFAESMVPPGVEAPVVKGNSYTNTEEPDLQTDFVQSFEYYEVPLILNYKFIDRKLGVNMAGGLSANILYQNKTFVEEEGDRYTLDGESEDINELGYNGIVSLAFDYPIFAKLFFNFQPTFKYSLNSLSKGNEVHPYSFGVYTGLRYSF